MNSVGFHRWAAGGWMDGGGCGGLIGQSDTVPTLQYECYIFLYNLMCDNLLDDSSMKSLFHRKMVMDV